MSKLAKAQREVEYRGKSIVVTCLMPLLLLFNNLQLKRVDEYRDIIVLISFLLISAYLQIKREKFGRHFWWAIITLGFATMSTIMNGSGYGSLVALANLLLFLSFFSSVRLNSAEKKMLLSFLLASLIVCLLIYSRKARNTYYYSIFPSLTKERLNPNTIAIYLFFAYVFASQLISYYRDRETRICFQLMLFVVMIALVLKTGARTTLGAFLIYSACLLSKVFAAGKKSRGVVKASAKKTEHYKKVSFFAICLVATFLFAFVYCALSKIIGVEVKILGKNLFTGRQAVWTDAFDKIKDNLLWGYSNKYVFNFAGMEYTNAHNSLISILFMFGVVPACLTVALMVWAYSNVTSERFNRFACVAIYCCLIIMTFETLLTDSNLYLYFCFLFLLGGEASDTQKDTLLLVRGKAVK